MRWTLFLVLVLAGVGVAAALTVPSLLRERRDLHSRLLAAPAAAPSAAELRGREVLARLTAFRAGSRSPAETIQEILGEREWKADRMGDEIVAQVSMDEVPRLLAILVAEAGPALAGLRVDPSGSGHQALMTLRLRERR